MRLLQSCLNLKRILFLAMIGLVACSPTPPEGPFDWASKSKKKTEEAPIPLQRPKKFNEDHAAEVAPIPRVRPSKFNEDRDDKVASSSSEDAPIPMPRPKWHYDNDKSEPSPGSNDQASNLCAFLKDNSKIKRCKTLFDKIPNKEALVYTLKYMAANVGGLADGSCVKKVNGKDGNQGTNRQSLVNEGIHNTCNFVINDVASKYQGFPYRSNAYFVDLCGGKNVVTKIYMNKGTGTGSTYSDDDGKHSTNVGAYLTSDRVFPFVPYSMNAAYRKLRKDAGGKIPALRLYGVQATNNDTSDEKPLHVSPYKSSWGCPSISLENAWVIKKLAANGPSLVMNYGPSKFHPLESVNRCDAIGDNGRPSKGKIAVRDGKNGKVVTESEKKKGPTTGRLAEAQGNE